GAIDITISPAGGYSYLWSNGETKEDLLNIPAGIYEVTVSDNFNCSLSEIFSIENISILPTLSELMTTPSCGESNGGIDLIVNPPNGNQFQWSNGDIVEDLGNVSKGNYSVTVTDINGCSATGSFDMPGSNAVEVNIDADLTAINSGTVTCTLILNVTPESISSIDWSPEELFNCTEPICFQQVFTLLEPTFISVEVIDTNGCIGRANMQLDIEKEFHVYIPNVFTPNGDTQNDMFTVYANKEVREVVRLEIFDRWGNCVFINQSFPPNEPSYGWNGSFKGNKMNPDVFAYWTLVRYSNGEEHYFKGDVTLLR
ncbi:MAG: T9SS type B sorting domain-containing protein, partial [Saprospiraceae bacterium]